MSRPKIFHRVIEVFDLGEELLNNLPELNNLVRSFIEDSGLNIVDDLKHKFNPIGATLVFVLSSSHLAVHTWPENNYLHLDLLCCDKLLSEDETIMSLSKIFKIDRSKISIRNINYG